MASTDPDFEKCDGITDQASGALFEQIDVIFGFRPSTLTGVAALLRYIAKLEDWQMARGLEESESRKVVQALCTSIAATIERIEVRA
jgi:hypothetical protein